MTHRSDLMPAFLILLACLALSSTAFSQTANVPDRTEFGSNVTVGPNEHVSDVTCFACSVRVRGQVDGDVTVFGGSIMVADQAEVGGDVTNFGRGVRLEGSAHVGGDVTTFGGPLRRDSSASIGGSVTTFSGSLWLILIFGLPILLFVGIVSGIIWIVRRIARPNLPVAA